VVLRAAREPGVLFAELLGDRDDRGVADGLACVGEERDRRRPAVGRMKDAADGVEVQAQDVVVGGR